MGELGSSRFISNRNTLAVESRALGAPAPRRNGEKGFQTEIRGMRIPGRLFLAWSSRPARAACRAGWSLLSHSSTQLQSHDRAQL
jgi:hypothetical protein